MMMRKRQKINHRRKQKQKKKPLKEAEDQAEAFATD